MTNNQLQYDIHVSPSSINSVDTVSTGHAYLVYGEDCFGGGGERGKAFLQGRHFHEVTESAPVVRLVQQDGQGQACPVVQL